ncbi:HK97-gp10 family putative phage morphogenesis protein [Aeromicrobium sp. Leaf272]|uniref:HK97-gp10 family putative phage morphogenesis protein n=1 Tax=Aeromicrobium sp. Leaf272 TaxID=1736317 RepID=UPI0009E86760
MATGVRVENLRQVQRDLTKLGVATEELKDSMTRVASHGADKARALAPVGRTGALAASVRGNKAKARATIKAGNKRTYYASFTEYGTTKQTAQEWMHRAVEETTPFAAIAINRDLTNLVRKYNLN